jgi:hypothetical protein
VRKPSSGRNKYELHFCHLRSAKKQQKAAHPVASFNGQAAISTAPTGFPVEPAPIEFILLEPGFAAHKILGKVLKIFVPI